MIQTFRESANIEKKPEDDEVLTKIIELEESIEKLSRRKKNNSLGNINNIKQIIWLGFEGPSDTYNEKLYLISQEMKKEKGCEDNKMLLFNNSRQIISFFKYLFAIKPKMQFKNLEDKFVIVIECSDDLGHPELSFQVKESELKQINDLFDWLSFAGCKIPVAVYTSEILDKNTRMIMINCFNNVSFIDDKFDLNIFLKINIEDSQPTKSPIKRLHFSENLAAIHSKFKSRFEKNFIENSPNLIDTGYEQMRRSGKTRNTDVFNFPQSKTLQNKIHVKPILKNIESHTLKENVNLNKSAY